MQTTAKATNIHMSPRKIRLLADLVRGRGVDQALVQLQFAAKRAAEPVNKLINSAIGNAIENLQLERSNLFIKEIKVDQGVTMHRWMPRAHGRATPIRKRTSAITLTLAERVPTDGTKKLIKRDTASDLVTVSNLDELKALEKVDAQESHLDDGNTADNAKSHGVKRGKGFVGKIFNRKAGNS